MFISPDRSEIPLKKSFFGTEEEVVADEDDDETGDAAPDATPLDEPTIQKTSNNIRKYIKPKNMPREMWSFRVNSRTFGRPP